MPLLVNGELIDDATIREEARGLRLHLADSVADMDPVQAEMELRELARERLIDRVLLRQEAVRDTRPIASADFERELERIRTEAGGQVGCGFRTSPEELRKEAETRVRVGRLVDSLAQKSGTPANKEIAEYYKRNKHRFWTDELVHAKHIVRNIDERQDEAAARRVIEQAAEELQTGEPFETVADRHSDCAGNGGDLGYFARGQMVDEFDDVVFNLSAGQTSGIFRTVFGYHIARVYGRKPAGIRPLSDVCESIALMLLRERQERAMSEFLDSARARSEIRTGRHAGGTGT